MTSLVLGLDPGAAGGVSLVESTAPARGRLLAAAHVTGTSRERWYRRAREVIGTARDAAAGQVLRVVLEEPPVRSRGGTLAGDKGGQRTWCGIGRYQGLFIAACLEELGIEPVLVPHGEWTAALHPLVRPRKEGDGWHRIGEAERWIVGSKEQLARIPKGARIDVAEASLFALAGASGRLPTLEARR